MPFQSGAPARIEVGLTPRDRLCSFLPTLRQSRVTMFVQLDKLERASAIHTNSAGEISETGAAQSEVTARDVEPLALAEPIVKCFASALTVPNCDGLSL